MRVLSSSSSSSSSSGDDSDSDSDEAEDDHTQNPNAGRLPGFKIPKLKKVGPWSDQILENFKKNFPHLRNFDDEILRHASLKELTDLGKSKVSDSKVLSNKMAATVEMLQNFPVQVEGGEDNCFGEVHKSRFLRGFVGDSQSLWDQARAHLGNEGLEPIANYEMVSLGVGDLLTPNSWGEIHKPGSMLLSCKMLSRKSVEEAWKLPDKLETPKEFENLHDLKMALLNLENAIHKVMPWNMSFKTLCNFLHSNDFGASELGGKSSRVLLISNFVDEILRTNARNWLEKKRYLSHQDLCLKWSTFLIRNQTQAKQGESGGRKKESAGKSQVARPPRPPAWLCKSYNAGACGVKDEKHVSSWDPTFILKHACSKMLDKGRCCLQNHPETEHK